ncbi:hypothetical protein WN943_019435 [Citrus x changshan-huyou]
MRGETPLRSNQILFVTKRSRLKRKLKRRPLLQSSGLSGNCSIRHAWGITAALGSLPYVPCLRSLHHVPCMGHLQYALSRHYYSAWRVCNICCTWGVHIMYCT